MPMMKKSFELWPGVFKRVWAWVLFSAIFQMVLTLFVQQIEFKESVLFFSWGVLFFALSLLISIVGNILINQAAWDQEHKKLTPLIESLNKNFKYMTIESMRAFWPIILRTLLLVIPGIIETVRLYWLIYVVQFDSAYNQGKVDALEQSRKFVKGRFLKSAGLLLFVFILSILPRVFGSEGELLHSPLKLGLAVFTSISFEIYGDLLLYRFYMNNK